MYQDICTRCGGAGYISKYSHVDRGICYRCKGTGVVEINYQPESNADAQARADRGWAKLKAETEGIYDVLHVKQFTVEGHLIVDAFSAEIVIDCKSNMWAKKIWWTLALWNAESIAACKPHGDYEMESMEQANIAHLIGLRNKKGSKHIASLINKEFARAKTKTGYYEAD